MYIIYRGQRKDKRWRGLLDPHTEGERWEFQNKFTYFIVMKNKNYTPLEELKVKTYSNLLGKSSDDNF